MIDSIRVQTVSVLIGTIALRRYKPGPIGHDGHRSRLQAVLGAVPMMGGGAVAFGRSA